MRLLFAGLSMLLLASCSKAPSTLALFECSHPVATKGGRVFGFDILNTSSAHSYADNLSKLKSLGGSYQTLHLTWSGLEGAGSGTASGAFTDPSNALQTFNALAASDGVRLALTIRPIDATGKSVPSDLVSTRFSAADMKTRFKALLDYVVSRVASANLVTLMIGNEIDHYHPGTDTNFWTDYGDFLSEIKTYANATYPGLKIGFTATHSGLTDSSRVLALGLNSVAVMQTYAGLVDAVGVTYYPLDSAFHMKDPKVVDSDFAVLDAFTTKPIFIQEIGFATSDATGGSETLQAQFYCETFRAWDEHREGIPGMAGLRLNDVTRTAAAALAGPYGISSEPFIEFLRTLGIFSEAGVEKKAFSTISAELTKRGF